MRKVKIENYVADMYTSRPGNSRCNPWLGDAVQVKNKGKNERHRPRWEKVMTRVGFEPTPFRTTESLWRFGLRVNLNVAP